MTGRSRVTITLGRSGQVVKGRAPEDYEEEEELGTSGRGKRSVRDRLGNGPESSRRNKRQRRENPDHMDDDDDYEKQDARNRRIGRDDLRFKLMHKSSPRRFKADAIEANDRDLRESLSRRNRGALRFDANDQMRESRSYDHARRLPPARSADDLLHLDSQRKSCSGRNADVFRHLSPDRLVHASRAISPSTRLDNPRRIPAIRSTDPSRPVSAVASTVVDSSRMGQFITEPIVPGQPSKAVMHLPPPNGALPLKSSYRAEEPLTVAGLLNSLGIGKYAINFQAEEVDMTALKQMSDTDLKELGIPMGPRKKILLAVASRLKSRR